ncbi:MAG: twin-arginine translocation signal domain-containing protein [Dethiobacter sp.]|jgi:hydrogenase small subunit|nr:MAG: twin-arginine translocation signal domain-containing protein [Dethiobacter sp.]
MNNYTDEKELSILKLEMRGVSRRTFLKFCAATAVLLGLENSYGSVLAEAAAEAVKKKPIIWLQGQGCTGCSCSLLSSLNPGPAEILLDMVSMRFNTTVMNAAGYLSVDVLDKTVKEGNYLLVIEGSIPTADPRYCVVEGMPFEELVVKTAKNAAAVVAVGTCSAYGGIPKAGITGAKSVSEIITDKPVINIPGCPFKPDWLVGTLLYYLSFNEVPPLDNDKRPLAYFGNHNIHDTCPRVSYFEKGQFLMDWNDPATVNWCLFKVGCKGPVTFSDCNRNWWNDGVNYCIRAGSPCAGCVQPQFYENFAPLYAPLFDLAAKEEPKEATGSDGGRKEGFDGLSVAVGAGMTAALVGGYKALQALSKTGKGETKDG